MSILPKLRHAPALVAAVLCLMPVATVACAQTPATVIPSDAKNPAIIVGQAIWPSRSQVSCFERAPSWRQAPCARPGSPANGSAELIATIWA